MAGNSQRQGAVRKSKKGALVGSGGQVKRALKGKGPTPPAAERKGHPAARKAAAAAARREDNRRQRPGDSNELLGGRNPVAGGGAGRNPGDGALRRGRDRGR